MLGLVQMNLVLYETDNYVQKVRLHSKDWFSLATESQSWSSRKSDYNQVKIRNRSRKRSHKLDGMGVGRIKTFPFLPTPFTTPSLMIQ